MIDQRTSNKEQRVNGVVDPSVEWISFTSRALWTMKHKEPKTSFQLLNAARRLANTVSLNLKTSTCRVIPQRCKDKNLRLLLSSLFASKTKNLYGTLRNPRDVQLEALALLSALPSISVITIKALATAATSR